MGNVQQTVDRARARIAHELPRDVWAYQIGMEDGRHLDAARALGRLDAWRDLADLFGIVVEDIPGEEYLEALYVRGTTTRRLVRQ